MGAKLVKPYGPDNLVADNGGNYSVYQWVDPVTGVLQGVILRCGLMNICDQILQERI
jgi:hypothetical protein